MLLKVRDYAGTALIRRVVFCTGVEMFSFSSSSLTELTLPALRESRLAAVTFNLEEGAA